jgi:hypothetical protein
VITLLDAPDAPGTPGAIFCRRRICGLAEFLWPADFRGSRPQASNAVSYGRRVRTLSHATTGPSPNLYWLTSKFRWPYGPWACSGEISQRNDYSVSVLFIVTHAAAVAGLFESQTLPVICHSNSMVQVAIRLWLNFFRICSKNVRICIRSIKIMFFSSRAAGALDICIYVSLNLLVKYFTDWPVLAVFCREHGKPRSSSCNSRLSRKAWSKCGTSLWVSLTQQVRRDASGCQSAIHVSWLWTGDFRRRRSSSSVVLDRTFFEFGQTLSGKPHRTFLDFLVDFCPDPR